VSSHFVVHHRFRIDSRVIGRGVGVTLFWKEAVSWNKAHRQEPPRIVVCYRRWAGVDQTKNNPKIETEAIIPH
jgi:hypothetical protein